MEPPSSTADAQKLESRRRHLVTPFRAPNASLHGTVQSSAAVPVASSTKLSSHRTPVSAPQQSSPARAAGSNSLPTSFVNVSAATTGAESSRGGSASTANSAKLNPSKAATYTRATAMNSRVPALTALELFVTSSQPRSMTLLPTNTEGKPSSIATAGVPEQSTVSTGPPIAHRSVTMPRSGESAGGSPAQPYSPYNTSPTSSWHLSQATPFGPNALTVYMPCDLFSLHHALYHRLVGELGWSLHWCLDTESEIQHLALAKELGDKARALETNTAAAVDAVRDSEDTTPVAEVKNPIQARDSAGAKSAESDCVMAPRHGDSATSKNYCVDVQGRQLPYIKQKSHFGVMSNHLECPLCHELAAVRRSAFPLTPQTRLSRSPYEFRFASLRRWLRKRSAETPTDALLASCFSVVAQRYLAYVGFADCWTSLFVTVGLPVAPSATREKDPRLPTTRPVAANFDRVPLSFYALPAVCRWRALESARVEALLRTATAHPFSLSMCFPAVAQGGAGTDAARMSSAVSSIASSLTFFTIQQQSYLPSLRRSSSQWNQMALLGESCVCDVYLLASNASSLISSSSNAADGSADATAIASVWGYVQKGAEGKGLSSTDGNQHGAAQPQTGELFYIAHSLENYLRMGIVFGWVYGWQMCFSTVGPPPNSVPWLECINASAYRAALAANSDTAP